MSTFRSLLWILAVLAPGLAFAQAPVNSGSDGTDGYLEVTSSNRTLNLSLARTDDAYAPGTGNGVYDAGRWAVVFKFDSVRVNSGTSLYFTNHPSGAPVVWLVKGNAYIDGAIYLNGQNGQGPVVSIPGPGGFSGGRGYQSETTPGSGGLGPGGGIYQPGNFGQGGSYGTSNGGNPTTYGNHKVLPLIGGSGGAGRGGGIEGGGAGGGAILIVADSTIFLNGAIYADGGYGCYGGHGSGGAIRLVCNEITGSGYQYARGGAGSGACAGDPRTLGGDGRIRIEANRFGNFNGGGTPNPITQNGIESGGAVVFPPGTAPTVRITSINDEPVPADPQSAFNYGDVNLSVTGPVTLDLACTNVPLDATVRVRVTPKSGQDYTVDASPVGGDPTTWRATLPSLPGNGLAAIQARAILP